MRPCQRPQPSAHSLSERILLRCATRPLHGRECGRSLAFGIRARMRYWIRSLAHSGARSKHGRRNCDEQGAYPHVSQQCLKIVTSSGPDPVGEILAMPEIPTLPQACSFHLLDAVEEGGRVALTAGCGRRSQARL